jgi:D-alanine-D-alanine ligase
VRPLRVTILYDAAEDAWYEEALRAAQGRGEPVDPPVHFPLGEALAARGHRVKKIAAQADALGLAAALAKDRSEVIFNVCDGLGGVTARATQVVGMLELFEKRFTGSGSEAMAIAQDKVLTKQLFAHYGIPSPRFAVLDRAHLEWVDQLEFPLIVKPSNEDASVGITEGAVVNDVRGLLERVSWIHTEIGRPALIEEYVEGREIYAALLGNSPPEVLPLLEWPLKRGAGGHRIATYEAKWNRAHADYQEVADHFATDLAPEIVERIERAAVKAYRALRLTDYARMDIRLAEDGTPYFLEVNANPFFDPSAEVAMAARAKGYDYGELAEKVLMLALERYPPKKRRRKAPLEEAVGGGAGGNGTGAPPAAPKTRKKAAEPRRKKAAES